MANTCYVPQISILVVDDDKVCLKIVRGILQQLNHHVVAINNPIDALSTLRTKESSFDLVLTDLHMPQMSGLELLKHVDEEFNLPVVLMSADSDKGTLLKGLQKGASFFFMKPISKYNLSRIWQHAISSSTDDESITDNPLPSVDFFSPAIASQLLCQPQMAQVNNSNNNYDVINKFASLLNEENSPTFFNKNALSNQNSSCGGLGVRKRTVCKNKPKLVWTTSLHNIFLEAVSQIGLDKAVPKKVLELMNIPGLKRENIASHLQKYRLFLKRIEDANFSMDNGIPNDLNDRPFRSSFAMNEITYLTNSLHYQYQALLLQQERARAWEARMLELARRRRNQVNNTISLEDNDLQIMMNNPFPIMDNALVHGDQIAGATPNQKVVQLDQIPFFRGFRQEFPSIVEQQQQQQHPNPSNNNGRISNNNNPPRMKGARSYNNNYVGLRISSNGELFGPFNNSSTIMANDNNNQATHNISGFQEKRANNSQEVINNNNNYHHEMDHSSFENDNNSAPPPLDDDFFVIDDMEFALFMNPNNNDVVADQHANNTTTQENSFGISLDELEMSSMYDIGDELRQLGIDLESDQVPFGNELVSSESYGVQGANAEESFFEGLIDQGINVNDDISFDSYFAQEYGQDSNQQNDVDDISNPN